MFSIFNVFFTNSPVPFPTWIQWHTPQTGGSRSYHKWFPVHRGEIMTIIPPFDIPVLLSARNKVRLIINQDRISESKCVSEYFIVKRWMVLTVTLCVITVCRASADTCNRLPTLRASASLKILATSNDSLWIY